MTIRGNGGVFGRNPVYNSVATTLLSTTSLSAIGGPIELDGNFPVGSDNVALGRSALQAASLSGGQNVGVGTFALGSLTTGSGNIAVGRWAMYSATTATESSALGRSALELGTSGGGNTAVGFRAIRAGGSLSYNTAVGWNALVTTVNGGRNVAVGALALTAMNPASAVNSNNTAVGYSAGELVTTGINNTIIGAAAGNTLTTGSNNIIIGQASQPSSVTISNETTLGNSSTTNTRIFGALTLASTGITWSAGSGSPEGVVTAPPGSFHSNTTGGAGTTLYVKETGTGNTGWVAK